MVYDTRVQKEDEEAASSGGVNNTSTAQSEQQDDFGLSPSGQTTTTQATAQPTEQQTATVPPPPPSNPLTQANQQQQAGQMMQSTNTVGDIPDSALSGAYIQPPREQGQDYEQAPPGAIVEHDRENFGLPTLSTGGGTSAGSAYSVNTPQIQAPQDNSQIKGAMDSAVLNYLNNPNRYDNDLVAQGMDVIRDRMARVREDTMRNATADIARTGMLTSTLGGQQLADTRQRLGEQENTENFRWGKTIADSFAADRNASLQAATQARAQELQKYGIDSQRAMQQAQLEMQGQQLSIESDLRDRALQLQRQGMDEQMARFQAEMEFNERWNQRNYDLDTMRFLGLEGLGGADAPGGGGTGGGGGGTPSTGNGIGSDIDFGFDQYGGGGGAGDDPRERGGAPLMDDMGYGIGDDNFGLGGFDMDDGDYEYSRRNRYN